MTKVVTLFVQTQTRRTLDRTEDIPDDRLNSKVVFVFERTKTVVGSSIILNDRSSAFVSTRVHIYTRRPTDPVR